MQRLLKRGTFQQKDHDLCVPLESMHACLELKQEDSDKECSKYSVTSVITWDCMTTQDPGKFPQKSNQKCIKKFLNTS